MRLALFLGCNIPIRLKHYETSSRAVLAELGIELIAIADFNCCGYPLRNVDLRAFVLSSARNLALAQRQDSDMLTLCKCGYGTLRMADHLMREDSSLRGEVNRMLSKEGLKYEGGVEVKHLLTVLFKDVGPEAIKEKVSKPYQNLKIATHYGCHALRPSGVVEFDDPVAPTLFDQLVEVTGADSVYWPKKLECCGGPVLGTHNELSFDLTEKKVADARKAGAHYLTTACTFCQFQFDSVQKMIAADRGKNHSLPSILYPQLLGLCMGIDSDLLELGHNDIDIMGIEAFLAT